MRNKLIHDQVQKTYAVIFDKEDEVIERKYDRESGLALIDI
jgi:hypothetical protein